MNKPLTDRQKLQRFIDWLKRRFPSLPEGDHIKFGNCEVYKGNNNDWNFIQLELSREKKPKKVKVLITSMDIHLETDNDVFAINLSKFLTACQREISKYSKNIDKVFAEQKKEKIKKLQAELTDLMN